MVLDSKSARHAFRKRVMPAAEIVRSAVRAQIKVVKKKLKKKKTCELQLKLLALQQVEEGIMILCFGDDPDVPCCFEAEE